ncbi:hypothetical protein CXQ84_10060 [Burkholderia pseudomallei]|nr:hypothetical protein CXQ84_10060 [Burkholderia pseudomallei]
MAWSYILSMKGDVPSGREAGPARVAESRRRPLPDETNFPTVAGYETYPIERPPVETRFFECSRPGAFGASPKRKGITSAHGPASRGRPADLPDWVE